MKKKGAFMITFEKNQRYTYSLLIHNGKDQKAVYCRATRTMSKDVPALCRDCPLFAGEDASCMYFDLDRGAEICPADQNDLTEGLIKAGLVPIFPHFLSEKKAIERFGIMEEAIQFAAVKHEGQIRKGSHLPYICHPIEVMMLSDRMTKDPEIAAAGALHDTLEDTDTTYDELLSKFGKRIADLVRCESEDKRSGRPKSETWRIRKQENLDRIATEPYDAKIIMLADKLSNMRSSAREYEKIGDKIFDRFNEKNKSSHAWYHRSVLRALSELDSLPQYREYNSLIEKVFG